jgi:hypothetical protein
MDTPDVDALASAIRACVQAYATANQGSADHVLGSAELGSLNEMLPQMRSVPSVKGGFAVRFKDGTTFLVNVHEIPGSKPGFQAPPAQGA